MQHYFLDVSLTSIGSSLLAHFYCLPGFSLFHPGSPEKSVFTASLS